MERLFNAVSVYFGIAGGILAAVFGTWDTVLYALVTLMVIDYITGVIKAVYTKQMSSETGFKGILKKITILAVVALANVIQALIGTHTAIREIVIMFYIANEGISILENAAEILPNMPEELKNILLQIRDNNTDK